MLNLVKKMERRARGEWLTHFDPNTDYRSRRSERKNRIITCLSFCSKFTFNYNDPDKTRKMQKRAARFADSLDTKKARVTPLTLQINQFVSQLIDSICILQQIYQSVPISIQFHSFHGHPLKKNGEMVLTEF